MIERRPPKRCLKTRKREDCTLKKSTRELNKLCTAVVSYSTQRRNGKRWEDRLQGEFTNSVEVDFLASFYGFTGGRWSRSQIVLITV